MLAASPAAPRPALTAAADALNPFHKFGHVLLLVFLFLAFSRVCDIFLSSLHLPLLTSSAAMIAALAGGGMSAALRSRPGFYLVGFTIWLVAAVPFSVWKGGSFALLKDQWIKSLAAFFIVAALIRTREQTAQVIRTLAFALLVAAVLALNYGRSAHGRFAMETGQYAGPNELASAMVLGFLYSFSLLVNESSSKGRRLFALAGSVVLFFVLMKTGSRAAMITVAVLFPFLFLRLSMRGRVVLLTAACAGLLSAMVLLPSDLRARYFTFFQSGEAQSEEEARRLKMAAGSTQGRLHLLMTSLELTFKNPLFGVGPGQFTVAENEHAIEEEGQRKGVWHGTHNTYTEISSEAGIPALAFYLGCMAACWTQLRRIENSVRNRKDSVGREFAVLAFTLRIVLLSYAVFYCFEHVAYAPFFPALAGLIVGFGRAADRELASFGLPGGHRANGNLVGAAR